VAVDHLWAPWRLSYVAAPKEKPATAGDDCFICRGVAGASAADDRANLVAHRTPRSVVILNRFPYNNGHLLVCPRQHRGRLDELAPEDLLDLQLVLGKLIGVLEKKMSPDGFNVGLNLGRAAGAGVPGHLHWHLVPRWNGDTNFMPVVGDTRVIVQSLEALFDLLAAELNPVSNSPPPPQHS
jgi:ATP adenylyltransferase